MLFNSYEFLFVFLPVVLTGSYLLAVASGRASVLWLAFASLVFYAYWNPSFVALLVASVIFNFLAGRETQACAGTARSRRLLVGSLAVDLGVLGVFKYTNFFVDTINTAFGAALPAFDVVLPIGISFFTFTQIAYLVDSHRGIVRESDFGRYLLFVSYFPHLVAGPVLHHGQVMPQFARRDAFRADARNIAEGATLFILGLAKKVLVADHFAGYVTPVFGAADQGMSPQLFVAWAGALSYTLQLYFDFSGYSDMALGLSKLFGVDLPVNFDSPYKARSIIDFWRRWHITLSHFLRDYLYIPLGGNRSGEGRRMVNVLVTMLLGGLWHGASWTFVAWGGLHGLFLVINQAWRRVRGRGRQAQPTSGKLGGALSWALTFLCVVCAWVVFRAKTGGSALVILEGMAGMNGISLPARWGPVLMNVPGVVFNGPFAGFPDFLAGRIVPELALGLAVVWFAPNSIAITRRVMALAESAPTLRKHAIAAGLAGTLVLSLLNMRRVSEFLYFQF